MSELELDYRIMEAKAEAVLFAFGKAVSTEDLSKALSIGKAEVAALMEGMMQRWNSEVRGTQIIRLEDAYQMCTRREYYPELITLELRPKKPHLSEAALETLSVIAYKQPVTKVEIERIRGVNSDHAVNRLIEYNLVCELGRAQAPGRPILFGTTEEFLRLFGVSSASDLPEVDPEKEEEFKEEAEQEIDRKL